MAQIKKQSELDTCDDIMLVGSSLSNTTTFAVNNANELTSMTDSNGTTTFGFDAWGRMTSKARGSYSATYAYKYGQMLCSVASNWPGEGNVSYNYAGSFQRREQTVAGTTTKFRWNAAFGLVNEEDATGNLTRTCLGRGGEISGSNPALGEAYYYQNDCLGSSRLITNDDSEIVTAEEYSPYGASYSAVGTQAGSSYAGLRPESTANLQYGAFRYYSPSTCRWMTRDPLGLDYGPNVYSYALGNPVTFNDPYGLCVSWGDFLDGIQTGLDVIGMVPGLGEPFDVIDGGIYLVRGDYANAVLSGASALPIVGQEIGAAKIGRKGFKWLDEGASGLYEVRKGEQGGASIRRGNRQIHFHNDPPYHGADGPHIDLQRKTSKFKNKGRLIC